MTSSTNLHFSPGQLKRIIVLGAGPQLLTTSDFCETHDLKLEIYTGERHRDIKLLTGETLLDALQRRGRKVTFCDRLDFVEQGPYETADEETLVLSFGSPFLIKQPLIDLYHGRVINSHGAPLPEFRGGGGLTWRFLAGDTRGAVRFHRITPIIDDGAVLYRRDFDFPWPAQSIKDWVLVDEKEQELGLNDFLNRLIAGEVLSETPQDESKATYFPRLNTDAHAFIDFGWPGEMVVRFIGAFSAPYSGASTFVGEDRIRIFSAGFVPASSLQHPFLHGLVLRKHDGNYWIACKDGVLTVPEQSMHPMAKVKLGDRLYTPTAYLDGALKTRIVYTPKGVK